MQRLKAARDAAGDTPAVEPPEKKARGGHHQRIAQHDASTASGSAGSGSRAPPQGPLNRNLVKRWAVGKLSAKDVQNIAMDAMLQGTPGIDRFAGMGARGAHDQNLFRAMRNALENPAGAPEMDWFEAPTTAGPRTLIHFYYHINSFRRITQPTRPPSGERRLLALWEPRASFGGRSKTRPLCEIIHVCPNACGRQPSPLACMPTGVRSVHKTVCLSYLGIPFWGAVRHFENFFYLRCPVKMR